MKKRIDLLLVEKGLCESREKAKTVIMAGDVFVAGQRADKAGDLYDETLPVEVRGDALRYVSRGGLKLEKAIKVWDIRLDGLCCADIGASTGGFCDCMLQNGAAKVYAVDVGYGQLAWSLRSDERVVVLEKTNARYLTREQIDTPFSFFSVDVSFISLKLLLPVIFELSSADASGVCLIKPQFEAGKEQVGKNGVIRDPKIHLEVINRVLGYARECGFLPLALDFSPIKGPKGNIEYLMYVSKLKGAEIDAENVVASAHETLKG